MSEEQEVDDRSWIPDAAIEGLKMERDLHPEKSNIEFTRELFRQNAPAAAASIVHLAIHSPNEKVRSDNARYVIERVLGRPGEENPHGRTPLEALMEGIISVDEGPKS